MRLSTLLNGPAGAPLDRGVMVMQNPRIPGVRLEWHPLSKKVYLLRIPLDVRTDDTVHAEPICEGVDTAVHAQNVGRAWFGGFQEARQTIRKEN